MTACRFTLGDSENAASEQCNTHSAEVERTRPRDLTTNALKHTVSAQRNVTSSTHQVTSGIER